MVGVALRPQPYILAQTLLNKIADCLQVNEGREYFWSHNLNLGGPGQPILLVPWLLTFKESL